MVGASFVFCVSCCRWPISMAWFGEKIKLKLNEVNMKRAREKISNMKIDKDLCYLLELILMRSTENTKKQQQQQQLNEERNVIRIAKWIFPYLTYAKQQALPLNYYYYYCYFAWSPNRFWCIEQVLPRAYRHRTETIEIANPTIVSMVLAYDLCKCVFECARALVWFYLYLDSSAWMPLSLPVLCSNSIQCVVFLLALFEWI